MLGSYIDSDCFKESVEMRAFYEMGLMLTFFLLCISVVQLIVNNSLGSWTPASATELTWDANASMVDIKSIDVSSSAPSSSTATLEQLKEKEVNVLELANQLILGWHSVFYEIFNPWGLNYIGSALIAVFTIIQMSVIIYSAANFVSLLRGGGMNA